MSLAIYDEDQIVFGGSDKFRPFVNGYPGGAHEEIIYIRNDDVTRWFTNVVLSVVASVYDADGELGSSGIGFKFIYGERRPTEAEWDVVKSGQPLTLPDIGTISLANTSTYHPCWIRVWVPGGTSAGIDDSFTLRLSFLPRLVGV
jgi:hypothetical protein